MEQSVEPNFFKKFIAIASYSYFAHISDFLKKYKDFSEKPVNLDMET